MNTLLVIDMQPVWFTGATKRFDEAGVIARINHAAAAMRQRGDRVVFIRHTDSEAVAGTPAWQVDPRLTVEPGDQWIDKTACDAFADTPLLETLKASGTNTVIICGLATEFCVDTTLRAALSHGFDVVALADAHTTGDRPHLTAAQIVEHHNFIWTHIAVPAGRRIKVCKVANGFGTSCG